MKTVKVLQHLCYTSHNEVLCRDEEDFIALTNSWAVTSFHNDTEILVDSLMSTHCHFLVFTANAPEFIQRGRHSYAAYFNRKYSRHGIGLLGERHYFNLPVVGLNHRLACCSYILRNGLHHGQSSSAFGYPHSTVNSIFQDELHPQKKESFIENRFEIYERLPRRAVIPDGWRMHENGMITRDSFEQIHRVEELYGTSRTFLYYMNRLSGEEWENEQLADIQKGDSSAPVSLLSMEPGYNEGQVRKMQEAEKGRKVIHGSDLELCKIIDKTMLPAYGKSSIYQLSDNQKIKMGLELFHDLKAPAQQISRCLVLDPDSIDWRYKTKGF